MFCRNCGKEIENGSRFCAFCGAQLNADSKSVEAPIIEDKEPKMQEIRMGAVIGIILLVLGLLATFYMIMSINGDNEMEYYYGEQLSTQREVVQLLRLVCSIIFSVAGAIMLYLEIVEKRGTFSSCIVLGIAILICLILMAYGANYINENENADAYGEIEDYDRNRGPAIADIIAK